MATATKKSHATTERAYSNQSRKSKPTVGHVKTGKYSDADYNPTTADAAANRNEEGRNAKDNRTGVVRSEKTGIESAPAAEDKRYQNADEVNVSPSRAGKDSDKDGLSGHAGSGI